MANLVLYSVDLAQRQIEVAHGAAAATEWTSGAWIGGLGALADLCRPDQRVELERRFQEAVTAKGSFQCELMIEGASGGRWLQITGALIGEPAQRIVGTCIDVTERHQREAILGLTESKLRAVLNVAAEGIVSVDELGQIESVNRAAAAMFGATIDQMKGAPWRSFLDQDPETMKLAPSRVIQARRVDGSGFPAELRVTYLEQQGGRLTLCAVRDLSELPGVERRVRDAREELRRRIGQDLHDGVGQLLTGTAFLAKCLEADVDADHRDQARRVVELINKAITRVRGLTSGLSIHQHAEPGG